MSYRSKPMDLITLFILFMVGLFIYKSVSKPKKKLPPQKRTYQIPSQTSSSNKIPTRHVKKFNTLSNSAKEQANLGNFDEASRLYLLAGQVYLAAKMKALKGPQFAAEAIDIIRAKFRGDAEKTINNLVSEFYDRLNKPAIAAALLRAAGYIDRAMAIEAIINTSLNPSPVSTVVVTENTSNSTEDSLSPTVEEDTTTFDDDREEELSTEEIDNFLDEFLEDDSSTELEEDDHQDDFTSSAPKKEIPNTMLMATTDLGEKCIACRRPIKSGDTFIYCLHCGKPGHYKHLGEMIKVTGKCPNCHKRLVLSMYDLE